MSIWDVHRFFSGIGDGTVVLGMGWVIVVLAIVVAMAFIRSRFTRGFLAVAVASLFAWASVRVQSYQYVTNPGEMPLVTGFVTYGLPTLAVIALLTALVVGLGWRKHNREEEAAWAAAKEAQQN